MVTVAAEIGLELGEMALEQYLGVSSLDILPSVLGGVADVLPSANSLIDFAEVPMTDAINIFKQGKRVLDVFKAGVNVVKDVGKGVKKIFAHNRDPKPGEKRKRVHEDKERQIVKRDELRRSHPNGHNFSSIHPVHTPHSSVAPHHPPLPDDMDRAWKKLKTGANISPGPRNLQHMGDHNNDYSHEAYGKPYSHIDRAVRGFNGAPVSGHAIGMGGAPALSDIHAMAGGYILPKGGIMEDVMGPIAGFSQKDML